MRHKNLDLIASIAIALCTIGLTLLPAHVKILQLLVVLPLVFLVPGYLVTETLFQRRQASPTLQTSSFLSRGIPRPLDTGEFFTLSIGLSLAIDIVGGFLLNLLPIGLAAISWAMLLGILTIVLSLVVAIQRLYRRQVNVSSPFQLPRVRLSMRQASLFGLAGVIVVLAILYSIHSAAQQPYPGFTQFWMLPPQSQQNSCTVQLGIRNVEGTPVTYRVVMEVNGASTKTWVPVMLDSQQTWSQSVPITTSSLTKSATTIQVTAQLYRMDKASVVYRQVHVQLPVVKTGANGKILLCGQS